MTLTGWSLPQSATGRAALLPAPPWHYSGEIIAVGWVMSMAFPVIGGTSIPLGGSG